MNALTQMVVVLSMTVLVSCAQEHKSPELLACELNTEKLTARVVERESEIDTCDHFVVFRENALAMCEVQLSVCQQEVKKKN